VLSPTLTFANVGYREYGSKVLGEVTLEQVYGGARGVKALVWEASVLAQLFCQSLSVLRARFSMPRKASGFAGKR
jgi:hypothetical protein